MSDITQFIPRADLDASKNVEEFIRFAREELTSFGDINWDSNHWDVTDYMKIKGRDVSIFLNFTDLDTVRNANNLNKPMCEPFIDFSKAFMRYQYGFKPGGSIRRYILVLRVIERALSEKGNTPRVEDIDAEIMNRAAQITKSRWHSSGSRGNDLEKIARFLDEFKLTRIPLMWKNPLPREKNTPKRVGVEADKIREKKLPTPSALDALARAFFIATDPRDRLVASTGGLFVSSPDRANEVITLPVDCEVYSKLYGKEVYGIRWWPSKGAEPMVKWIVDSMKDVAKEAIKNIKELTAEGRKMALWYEQNPDKLYLPEDFEYLRAKKYLYTADLETLLGKIRIHPGKVSKRLGLPFDIEKIGNIQRYRFKFMDFEQVILKSLPKDFPYLDKELGLKYSEALYVVPNDFFRGISASKVMFTQVTWDHINRSLNGKTGKFTIFDRLELTEPDGSRISIGTQQFRHWLNTLAQKGGLSQLDIAKWSGRKNIHQNATYDHLSGHELVKMIREVDDGSMFGPLGELATKSPISRDEFLALKIPTAHVTELGVCIHDWTMLPCQKHRDCINCTEHFCIKGDIKKTAYIKDMLSVAEIERNRQLITH